MKLSNPSILRVEVDPDTFRFSPRDRKALHYLLDRLFGGQEVAEAELEAWGLKVALADEFVAVGRLNAKRPAG